MIPIKSIYRQKDFKDKMGLCSSTRSTHRDVIAPGGEYHAQIEHEFAIYLALDNPHNVNHKYTYLYTPIKETFAGRGIKKTYGYTSKVSIGEITKKRNEFWGNIIQF